MIKELQTPLQNVVEETARAGAIEHGWLKEGDVDLDPLRTFMKWDPQISRPSGVRTDAAASGVQTDAAAALQSPGPARSSPAGAPANAFAATSSLDVTDVGDLSVSRTPLPHDRRAENDSSRGRVRCHDGFDRGLSSSDDRFEASSRR